MKHPWNRAKLYHPDNNEGGNSGDEGQSGADKLGAAEAIKFRKLYNELKEQHDQLQEAHDKLTSDYGELKGSHDKLTRKHAKLETEHGDAVKKLTGFESAEIKKKTVDALLESDDFKGKVRVDREKLNKFLEKITFNQDTLEQDVRDAIDMIGQPLNLETALSVTGPSGNNGHGQAPTAENDPLGDILRA